MSATARRLRGSPFVRRDLAAAFMPWLVARVLVGAALGLARYGFGELEGAERPVPLRQGMFAWDAAFYREIAEQGYGSARDTLRFFPLVPLLSRWLGALFAGNEAVALLVIGNGSALLLVVLLHRLALRETGDARLARRAAWFGAVFPPAFVLVMGYAEATTMALAAGMLLALRERRWWWAVPAGVLAGLGRPAGALLAVPAAIEAARGWRRARLRERLASISASLAPAAGTAVYLAWVWHTRDDAWLPFRLQSEQRRRGGFADPVSSVVDGVGDLVGGDRFGSGLHVVWAVLFVGLVVVLARTFPASYSAYAAATVLLGLSAENLDSFERYAINAFPLLLAMAVVTTREEAERPALVLAGAGMMGYATLAFLGRYVP